MVHRFIGIGATRSSPRNGPYRYPGSNLLSDRFRRVVSGRDDRGEDYFTEIETRNPRRRITV